MDVATAFGKVLRRTRLHLALTQETLALNAELQRNYVSLMERGKHEPTLSTIIALSEALGCSPVHLVSEVMSELSNQNSSCSQ
ncbi:XRE family transcriptional regulator [Pseudomonas sp. FBF18]|uniref:helix-turn-helix domain-containing protein n=1 Tax=Pseudomonas TaxID=286 RepID=UPI001F34C87B|nr:helix-turn-helix transcriptional regulator [Pseudomonas qingdaonensis]MCP8349393.1 XRE family transcriptional regulator [Pseudomonas sp. FBF18]